MKLVCVCMAIIVVIEPVTLVVINSRITIFNYKFLGLDENYYPRVKTAGKNTYIIFNCIRRRFFHITASNRVCNHSAAYSPKDQASASRSRELYIIY